MNTTKTATETSPGMTIFQQLGPMALRLLGARDLAVSSDSATFGIGAGPRKISRIRIVIDAADTYTVEFYRGRGVRMALVQSRSGVYADQMNGLIEAETGLYTRF